MKQMTDEEYIKGDGNKCPFCGSEDITGGSIDVEGHSAVQEVSCNECNKEWHDIYQLIGYQAIS